MLAERIERVFAAFQVGRNASDQLGDGPELIRQLQLADPLFLSVAFEGAASGLAYAALKQGLELPTCWAEEHFEHRTQTHIGIGWAIAELALRPDAYLNQFSGIIQGRILDGYGYYNGLFDRRRSIVAQSMPDGIPEHLTAAFDQGLGRAIWYISKGDTNMASATISAFDEARQPHLWRGIGVASTYVGGLNTTEFQDLLISSAAHQTQLKIGAVLCAIGRKVAGTDMTETLLALECYAIDHCLAEATRILAGSADYEETIAELTRLIQLSKKEL